jgi:hypothetical protein
MHLHRRQPVCLRRPPISGNHSLTPAHSWPRSCSRFLFPLSSQDPEWNEPASCLAEFPLLWTEADRAHHLREQESGSAVDFGEDGLTQSHQRTAGHTSTKDISYWIGRTWKVGLELSRKESPHGPERHCQLICCPPYATLNFLHGEQWRQNRDENEQIGGMPDDGADSHRANEGHCANDVQPNACGWVTLHGRASAATTFLSVLLMRCVGCTRRWRGSVGVSKCFRLRITYPCCRRA